MFRGDKGRVCPYLYPAAVQLGLQNAIIWELRFCFTMQAQLLFAKELAYFVVCTTKGVESFNIEKDPSWSTNVDVLFRILSRTLEEFCS